MPWSLNPAGRKVRTLLMASTSAHCLNDLLFLQRSGTLPIEIPAIVSNHKDLAGLAEFYGIPFHYIPVTRDTKARAEDELRALMAEHDIELTVLARYMQILSDELCTELTGKAINIHHSFLPSFKGAKPYHQAHARGVKLIGATAHYVTAALDEGPIIEQEVIRVDHRRTAEQFVQMGRDVEGRTLAQAVQWHAEHRVLLDGNRTVVFNRRQFFTGSVAAVRQDLLAEFVALLKAEGRRGVLGLNCALGSDGLLFVQSGIHFTGVDPSEENVHSARARGLDVAVAGPGPCPSPTRRSRPCGPRTPWRACRRSSGPTSSGSWSG